MGELRRERSAGRSGRNRLGRAWRKHVASQNLVSAIKAKPFLLVGVPLLTTCLLMGLGLWGVMQGAALEEANKRAEAETAAGEAADGLRQELARAVTPTITMSELLVVASDWPKLEVMFPKIAASLITLGDPGDISSLQLAPNGVVSAIFPLAGNEKALGLDNLATPSRRADALRAIGLGHVMTVAGPLKLVQGFWGMIARIAAFVPGPPLNSTEAGDQAILAGGGYGTPLWNGPPSNGSCGSICYHPKDGQRFWGFVTTIVNLDHWYNGQDERLLKLRSRGLHYAIYRPNMTAADPSTERTLVTASDPPPGSSTVAAELAVPGSSLPWVLVVGPPKTWATAWLPGVAAMIVVLALLAGLLIFSVLYSRHQHRTLLRALVPKKVINQMRSSAVTMDKCSWAGTPAAKLIDLTSQLLEGQAPDMQDVVMLRSAALTATDMYRPVDMKKTIAANVSDAETGAALLAMVTDNVSLGELERLRNQTISMTSDGTMSLLSAGGERNTRLNYATLNSDRLSLCTMVAGKERWQLHEDGNIGGMQGCNAVLEAILGGDPVVELACMDEPSARTAAPNSAYSSFRAENKLMLQGYSNGGMSPRATGGAVARAPAGLNGAGVHDGRSALLPRHLRGASVQQQCPGSPGPQQQHVRQSSRGVSNSKESGLQPASSGGIISWLGLGVGRDKDRDKERETPPLTVHVSNPAPLLSHLPRSSISLSTTPAGGGGGNTTQGEGDGTGNGEPFSLQPSTQLPTTGYPSNFASSCLASDVRFSYDLAPAREGATRRSSLGNAPSGMLSGLVINELSCSPELVELEDCRDSAPPRPILDEVEVALAAANEWTWDPFRLNECTNGRPLSTLGFFLIHQAGLIRKFKLDTLMLARFLRAVEETYSETNPYHNRIHAADVLQSMHVLMLRGGLVPNYAEPLIQLAAYIAAVVHDCGHTGTSNDYLVAISHKLALQYNDQSPLENFHASACWQMVQRQELNFLAALPKSEMGKLRKMVIDLVLATDMKKHFAILGAWNTLHSNSERHRRSVDPGPAPPVRPSLNGGHATAVPTPSVTHKGGDHDGKGQHPLPSTSRPAGAPPVPLAPNKAPKPIDDAERLLALQMCMKVSDLGHLSSTLSVHLRWVEALQEEFFRQGDRERAAGLPISPLCDRSVKKGISKSQCGFFSFLVLPLFKSFGNVFHVEPVLEMANANFEYWQQHELRENSTTEGTRPAA